MLLALVIHLLSFSSCCQLHLDPAIISRPLQKHRQGAGVNLGRMVRLAMWGRKAGASGYAAFRDMNTPPRSQRCHLQTVMTGCIRHERPIHTDVGLDAMPFQGHCTGKVRMSRAWCLGQFDELATGCRLGALTAQGHSFRPGTALWRRKANRRRAW